MKFCADIQDHQRMNPADFGNFLNFLNHEVDSFFSEMSLFDGLPRNQAQIFMIPRSSDFSSSVAAGECFPRIKLNARKCITDINCSK